MGYDALVKTTLAAVVAAALVFSSPGLASTYDPRPDRWGISEAAVRSHMEFLASDALNGRGSGTRDEWIAAEYIASQFRRWALEPLGDDGGFVTRIAIERSEITSPPVLSFQGRHATHGSEMTVTSVAATRISGPLQHYREGTPVQDRAVLLLPSGGAAPPGGLTAAAAIVLSLESEQLRTRREAGTPSPRPLALSWIQGVPTRAAVALDAATHAALAALPEGTQVALETRAGPSETRHTWNVIGKLTGSSRSHAQDAIVLSAHLDHVGNRPNANPEPGADTIYNGADDDASGTTAVLELAQAMAWGKRPKRTVIFALFGSEEAGGLGSRHFIDAGPVPLTHIVANLQFEMIGRPDPKIPAQTLWLTGYERSDLGSELARRGARLVADPHRQQNFFTRSDNIQFARRGVVAHTVSSFGLHTDYHRPSDEVGTIDFRHMTTAIRSMVQPILWLANSSFQPEWHEGQRP
ncbi:M20/M25/M40 family metallo-hydrolase [soil metagenome]